MTYKKNAQFNTKGDDLFKMRLRNVEITKFEDGCRKIYRLINFVVSNLMS